MSNSAVATSKTDSIAKNVLEVVFSRHDKTTTTFFLCGKSLSDESSMRRRVVELIDSPSRAGAIEIVFPEDLFDDLLAGPQHVNLLTLENQLARFVDILIVIPESAGSIAELGAFANHDSLRPKLICLQDKARKKDRSFINYGPIRLLKDKHEGKVLFYDKDDLSSLRRPLANAVLDLKKLKAIPVRSRFSILDCHLYLQYLLYVFESPDYYSLLRFVRLAIEDDMHDGAVLHAGLSRLLREHLLDVTSSGFRYTENVSKSSSKSYKLSEKGIDLVHSIGRTNAEKNKLAKVRSSLDGLRIDLMRHIRKNYALSSEKR